MDDDTVSLAYAIGLALVLAWIYGAVAIALAFTTSIGTAGSVALAVGFGLFLVVVVPRLPHPVENPAFGTSFKLDVSFLAMALLILLLNVRLFLLRDDALDWVMLLVGVALVAVAVRNVLPHVR